MNVVTQHTDRTKSLIEKRIKELLDTYKANGGHPIEVSFRDMIPELNNADRATHLIHTYPAKLLMHIPFFFLNNEIFSKKGDIVLDPFSGSGTVMLESLLSGRNAIASDTNPLARLISKVKTTKYNSSRLQELSQVLFKEIKISKIKPYPEVINIDHWFYPKIKEQLNDIFHTIDSMSSGMYQDFFWICFSNCVKKVSLADPRVSVPVRLRYDQYRDDHPLWQKTKNRLDSLSEINVKRKFQSIVEENIERFRNLSVSIGDSETAEVISSDARDFTNIDKPILDGTVDLVITSPPYAGAQKYIRASSLNLGWLNMIEGRTLTAIEETTIGRENFKVAEYKELQKTGLTEADQLLNKIYLLNPSRAHIAAKYLNEMDLAIREMTRVLKVGGHLILVAANNDVCGMEFKTQEYLQNLVEKYGLTIKLRLIDHIKSRGLMTKRNKTASLITREWVMVFEK